MVSRLGPSEDIRVIKFGGGINSRASEEEIDPLECAEGRNFKLDLQDRQYKPREFLDVVGTAPNGAPVRGFAQLEKANGDLSTLVQAGDTVYDLDASYTFTQVATGLTSTARLRGPKTHTFPLDDKVLITDLSLQEPVKEWDGTTFQNLSHNLTGAFKARYCHVSNERAMFANVESNATATPHMLVGSARGDASTLTITNRPSSGATESDPFYLLSLDLLPINGLTEAFGKLIFSTRRGNLYYLDGSNAQDFMVTPLYPDSAADGDESMAFVGNDVFYGRSGRIESLLATDRFGDVEVADLSVPIQNQITGLGDWATYYNPRLQRAYFLPGTGNEAFAYFKPLRDSGLSPWSRYTTNHPFSFQPTAGMTMRDPQTELQHVYLGASDGKVIRLDGTGNAGDGGDTPLIVERLSNLIQLPGNAHAYRIDGYLKYRQNDATTATITFEFAGESIFDEAITVPLTVPGSRQYYSGSEYYGGSTYYNARLSTRLTRSKFTIPGFSNEFQIRVRVEGSVDFNINEIGIRFEAASA